MKGKEYRQLRKNSQLKTKLELKENTSVQTEAPPGRAPRPYFYILGAKNFPKQNTFRILRRKELHLRIPLSTKCKVRRTYKRKSLGKVLLAHLQ